jgi:hypothetical protein
MRCLPLPLIAFPTYGAPVCTDATYSTIGLRVLSEEWKEVVQDQEAICIIARLEWAHKDLEVATIQTPVQENSFSMAGLIYRNCPRANGGRR